MSDQDDGHFSLNTECPKHEVEVVQRLAQSSCSVDFDRLQAVGLDAVPVPTRCIITPALHTQGLDPPCTRDLRDTISLSPIPPDSYNWKITCLGGCVVEEPRPQYCAVKISSNFINHIYVTL